MLKYLARYTHHAAVSNRRLIRLEGDEVEFFWKDYADGRKRKTMILKATEFIRRFLLHVLPTGFARVRHHVFLSNRVCHEKPALCRSLLAAGPIVAAPEPNAGGETGFDATGCPVCGQGRLVTFGTLRPAKTIQAKGEPTLQEARVLDGAAAD